MSKAQALIVAKCLSLLGMAVVTVFLYAENRALMAAGAADVSGITNFPGAEQASEDGLQGGSPDALDNSSLRSLDVLLAEIEAVESELSALDGVVHPNYERIVSVAKEEASEEFFREYSFYANLLENAAEARLPASEEEVREAQAFIMSSYVSHLIAMGINDERIESFMDRLVNSQVTSRKNFALYNVGEMTQEELAQFSPNTVLGEVLTANELQDLRTRRSGAIQAQNKQVLTSRIARYTPSLTPSRRELIAETYNTLYQSPDNRDMSNEERNEATLNRTREALEAEFSGAELAELEAFLQSQLENPLGAPAYRSQ